MPVELVFIHGWGFDASFWDGVCAQLDQQLNTQNHFDVTSGGHSSVPLPLREERGLTSKMNGEHSHFIQAIDLGFFKDNSAPLAETLKAVPDGKRILIGHSLGFILGMNSGIEWDGWIAINSFARFVKSADKTGCVTAPVLRDMRMRLGNDAPKTVKSFHDLIGASDRFSPGSSPKGGGSFNIERLRGGLDVLRDFEVDLAAARNIPGLVLAGAKDPLVPVEATAPLAAIAAESELYEDAGHLIPQSHAGRCRQDIADFIREHFGSTDAYLTHSA